MTFVENYLFKQISATKFKKRIIDPVIQRNEYFSHPENLLLAMLTYDKPTIISEH